MVPFCLASAQAEQQQCASFRAGCDICLSDCADGEIVRVLACSTAATRLFGESELAALA